MSIRSELRRMLREQAAQSNRPVQGPPIESPLAEEPGWFMKTLDYLSRGQYASAALAKSLVTGQGNPLEEAWKGLKGVRKTSYNDVLEAVGYDKGLARAVVGFAGDVLLDPTTYVTFGAGAGIKAAVSGTTKVLTKGAGVARAAHLATKEAQALKLLRPTYAGWKQVAAPALSGSRLERVLASHGLTMQAPGMTTPLMAKELAARSTARGIERATAGRAVAGPLSRLVTTPGTPIIKESTLRFAGMPILPKGAGTAITKGLGAGYRAAERVPLIGKILIAARRTGMTVKDVIKKTFSASTGLPELDLIMKRAVDAMDFKTVQMVRRYVDSYVKPLKVLKKESSENYDLALKQIQTYLEGVSKTVKDEVRDDFAEAAVKRSMDQLTEALNRTSMVKGAAQAKQGKAIGGVEKLLAEAKEQMRLAEEGRTTAEKIKAHFGVEPRAAKVARAAKELARKQSAQDLRAHVDVHGDLVKEMRARGIKPVHGIAETEFKANIPKWLRRKDGMGIDEWVGELIGRGTLKAGATQEDLYHLIQQATKRPGKVDPEKMLEAAEKAVPAEQRSAKIVALEERIKTLENKKAALEAQPIDPTIQTKIDGLEKTLLEEQGKLAGLKPIHVDRSILLLGEEAVVHKFGSMLPVVKQIGERLKKAFDDIWEAERKGLALAPEKRTGYFPHYMKDEVREMLVDVVRSDRFKMLRTDFSGRLSETQRRTITEGTVDKTTIQTLIDSGLIDGSKVKKALQDRGIFLDAFDELVFEQNPIVAALKRELHSIRALNAVDMAKEVLHSPAFLKARFSLLKPEDLIKIRQTIAQHPDSAVFVPTKTFVEKLKSPLEREAMRKGADKAAQARLLEELDESSLGRLLQDAGQQGTDVYVLPREVADHLSKAYSMQFDEKVFKDFLAMTDKVTSWWKAFSTVWRPGFHVRNEVSNLWQMGLAGFRNPAYLYKSLIMLTNPKLAGDVAGYTAEQALELADRYGIRKTGFIGAEVDEFIEREVTPVGVMGQPGILPRIPGKGLLSQRGPLIGLGTKLGTAIEDHSRLALFIDGLEKGMDPTAAAMRVKKYLFDYRDLSKYEKGIFRRLIPFYTFTRKAIPVALESMLVQPGWTSALGKLRTAGEKNVEDPVPRQYLSSFIRDGLGVPMRKGEDGKTEFFLLSGWIPSAELGRMDAQSVLAMLHPAPKAVIELATNRSLFTGRPVERFPGEKQEFLSIPMRGHIANIARNVTVLQELDRVAFQQDASLSTTGTRLLTGFRTYKQDKVIQMRSKVYELQDLIGQLKNAAALATKKYGGQSSILRQAEENLQMTVLERDRVKKDLLDIDPDALSTKRPDATPKPTKIPTTVEGLRRQLDIHRLLRPPATEEKRRVQ